MKEIIHAAISFAKKGLPVIPVNPETKAPYLKAWQNTQTVKEDQIRRWQKTYGNFNIALVMGEQSQLFCIDAELDGVQAFSELCRQNRFDPHTTLWEKTPRGEHYYFKYPAQVKLHNTAGRIAPHVDTRGAGGYVICAPSKRPDGKQYEWQNSVSPLNMPLFLFNILAPDDKSKGTALSEKLNSAISQASSRRKNEQRLNAYIAKAVNDEIERVRLAPEGERNNSLNLAAHKLGMFVPRYLAEEEVFCWLEEAAQSCGLKFSEIQKTIKSGIKSGMSKPRRIEEQLERNDKYPEMKDVASKVDKAGKCRKKPLAPKQSPGGKPVIIYMEGELPRMTRELQSALVSHVYQSDKRLLDIIKISTPRDCGTVTLKPGATVINTIDADYLNMLAAELVDWYRFDGRTNSYLQCNPKTEVLRHLLASYGRWTFPVLDGLVTCPIIRKDGSLLDKPGYDANTRIYADFDPGIFGEICKKPGKTDALYAMDTIEDALSEFCFNTDVDRSVALAAILTTVLRPSVTYAPLFAFSSPTPGTGKSALCNLVSILGTGREAAAFNYNPDEAEFRKAMFALLVAGHPVIVIDNAKDLINNDALCSILSQSTYTDRILGKSETVTVATSSLFMINGNNLQLTNDMTRRALYCVLDAKTERPASRKFKRVNFEKWIKVNRGILVCAALTILRAWIVAREEGAQDITTSRPMNGYTEWSSMVRGALCWLGRADPLESQRNIEKDDPERQILSNLLSAWWECHGNRPMMLKDLLQQPSAPMSAKESAFYEALQSISGNPKMLNSKSFGKWLRRYENRIVDSYRVRKFDTYQHAVRWQVEKV